MVANSVLTFGSTFDVDGEDIFRMARKLFPNCVTILTGTHATNYPGVVVQKKICDFSALNRSYSHQKAAEVQEDH